MTAATHTVKLIDAHTKTVIAEVADVPGAARKLRARADRMDAKYGAVRYTVRICAVVPA